MNDLERLTENLARFNEVTDRLEDEDDIRHFYHALVVQCAKRMKHGTFLQALHEAKEMLPK